MDVGFAASSWSLSMSDSLPTLYRFKHLEMRNQILSSSHGKQTEPIPTPQVAPALSVACRSPNKSGERIFVSSD
jgi:hypothetical protein